MLKQDLVLANADTGSEIDLVSAEFCHRRDFSITAVNISSPMVQFADGSTASLLGQIQTKLVIGKIGGLEIARTFYVLEDLTCDMLLGEELLNESDAFETFKDAFFTNNDECLAQVNTIVWLNKWERWFSRNKTELPIGRQFASSK